MKSWSRPEVPVLPTPGCDPRLWDSASGSLVDATPTGIASLYVCGITPYDATHIGHAATYLAYDTLVRLWLDSGYDVNYVQNTTDVDDPLLERARATGVDWRDLAAEQTELFRGDMEALRILPPDHYIAVTEVIPEIAAAVAEFLELGIAYRLDTDVYFDIAAAEAQSPWRLGDESHLDRVAMLALSAERGGDPDRAGKRDALDPLLWRGAREDEPHWPSVMGDGRPGWHIECSVIASANLDLPVTVQGGGADLIFPHHEFSDGHAAALTGSPIARIFSHAGLVAYQGEKISKSLGNLVLVSRLMAGGTDPQAIRLAILANHYRASWEWTESGLTAATDRLGRWRAWAGRPGGTTSSLAEQLRAAVADDLDTPAAIAAVDAHISAGYGASAIDLDLIDALLGIRLKSGRRSR